jgi:hypothetical protein
MILADPFVDARVPDHWLVELVVTAALLGLVALAQRFAARRLPH